MPGRRNEHGLREHDSSAGLILVAPSRSGSSAPAERLRPVELEPLEGEPLVSILIANYNYSRYLPQAIESALGQTYANLEVIVCDDGSHDDSVQVVDRYAAGDKRVQVIAKENGGYPSAINAAFDRSRGAILCILDADDVFVDGKVATAVASLRREAGLHCHQVKPVDAANSSLGPPIPNRLSKGWLGPDALGRGGEASFAPASGISLRREVAELVFPLPERLRRGADEYITRSAQFVTPVAATSEALALYRIHGSNTTGLWSADPRALRGFIEDNVKLTHACRDFLARVYDSDIATCLHDEDRPSYWEARLGLRIVEPGAEEAAGVDKRELANMIPDPRRRRMWALLLSLPPSAARRLLALWWGDAPLKASIKKAASRARGRSSSGSATGVSPDRPLRTPSLTPITLPRSNDEPLVSVLIANHNYERFLEAAVDSALKQSYARIEVVVCDDGSTDGSPDLLERLAREHPNVRAIRQANAGQSSALSAAFEASSGEIITLLDADDYMHEDKVRRVVERFRDTDAGMVIHQMTRVDEEGNDQGTYPMASALPEGWQGPAALRAGGYVPWIEAGIMSLRREVAERIFPLPVEAGQFADVILRGAAALLAPIEAIPEPLAFYRLHGANVGNTARRFDRDEMLERRRRDLEEVTLAYAVLDDWVRANLPAVALAPFESTRPYLERRYVIARLAGEPRAERRALLTELLARPETLSPRLRAFLRASPLLPRPLFKTGLEFLYGQGALKATLSRLTGAVRRLRP